MSKKCFVMTLIIWLASSAALAQKIDLLEAYRLAVERDPQIAAARAQMQAQLEQVPQARAQLLPEINASAGASRTRESRSVDGVRPTGRNFPVEALEGSTSYNSANAGLNLRLALFRRKAFIALRQAHIIQDRAEVAFEMARQQLGLTIAEAYFAAVEAKDAVRTYKVELRAVNDELERAQRQFELGVGTVLEVNDAKARLAATNANLLQARNRLRLAYETLHRRMNAPVSDVVGLATAFRAEAPQPDTPESWVDFAELQSLAVRNAELSLDVARAGVDLARSQRYPQIDLVASVQRDYQGENPVAGGIGMETDLAMIGIQLNWPLFAGGAIRSSVRQNIDQKTAAFHRLQDTKRSSELSTESSFIEIESSLEQISALAEALEAVQLSEESTQRALELGQRTTLDLLNIQRERFQIERNLNAARYQYLLAYLHLHASVGAPIEDAIQSVNAFLKNE